MLNFIIESTPWIIWLVMALIGFVIFPALGSLIIAIAIMRFTGKYWDKN